jgi:hypothetical protein
LHGAAHNRPWEDLDRVLNRSVVGRPQLQFLFPEQQSNHIVSQVFEQSCSAHVPKAHDQRPRPGTPDQSLADAWYRRHPFKRLLGIPDGQLQCVGSIIGRGNLRQPEYGCRIQSAGAGDIFCVRGKDDQLTGGQSLHSPDQYVSPLGMAPVKNLGHEIRLIW